MNDLTGAIQKKREHHQELQLKHAKLGTTVDTLQLEQARAGREAQDKFGASSFAELTQRRDELQRQNEEALRIYEEEMKVFEQELAAVSEAVAGMAL